MITVGIIGLKNHAERLRILLEPIANVMWLYHPTRVIDDPRCTQEFNKLLGCDAIVVASPNDTHFDYLMRLKDYEGYILCEKPPAVTPNELITLEDDGPDRDRLMINYTYRYSELAHVIKRSLEDGRLGDLVSFSAVMSHGLAFKPDYPSSWRADKSRHRLGVIETLGVHMIDLMGMVCNLQGSDPVSTIEQRSSVVAKTGSAYDTSRILIRTQKGVTGDIHVSYAMPFMFEVNVLGTNGSVNVRDGQISVSSPRDTFDERGFFISPPKVWVAPYDAESMYELALKEAVSVFITTVERHGKFKPTRFETCWAISAFR